MPIGWLALAAAEPNLTLAEIRDRLAARRGLDVSVAAVWRFLKGRDLRFKKPCTPPSKTGLTSPNSGLSGARRKPACCPNAWSSSTRPGRRRT